MLRNWCNLIGITEILYTRAMQSKNNLPVCPWSSKALLEGIKGI
jgi:hypothetical protein